MCCREFLDGLGFTHREEGDLGPVYGFQWRHFGASYSDMHTDYSGQGIDQLKQVTRHLPSGTARDLPSCLQGTSIAILELTNRR